MSPRPPRPGRRVAVGRLRVDAKRAIAKLRDYQLADRTAWVLEAVRAAVAAGGTDIRLTGDANDVWLAWTGEPWPAKILPALLDELVSPESHGGQKLRLLATAINSALGLDPVFVDVTATTPEKAVRARYTPALLEIPEDDDDDGAFEGVDLETISRPNEAPETGMLIHVRRRTGLKTLGFFFAGEPPELPLARRSCRDITVPMRIGEDAMGRHLEAGDLLRVDFPAGVDGFIALTDPAHPTPERVDIAEHGVVIASYDLDLVDDASGPLPLRALINGPRMQTNASRSDVNHDAHPVSTAFAHASAVFESLCDQLATELTTTEDEDRRERLRRATLALLSGVIGGERWMLSSELTDPLSRLEALPLVYNAVGELLPLNTYWEHELVLRTRKPADLDLRPWLHNIPWVRDDDPALQLWGPHEVEGKAAKKKVRNARKARRAETRFRRHKKRKAAFKNAPAHWVRAPIGATPPGSCASGPVGESATLGVTGELLLPCRGRLSEIMVLLDGRELDELELESPIAFRAIVNATDLTPGARYRHVERDTKLARVERILQAQVVAATEALVLACDGELASGFGIGRSLPDSRVARQLFRAALSVAISARLHVGDDSPLARVKCWSYADGRSTSLAELRGHESIGTVSSPGSYTAIANRPLVVASLSEHWVLRTALGQTTVVNYEISRLERERAPAKALHDDLRLVSTGMAVLRITTAEGLGAIAWGVRDSRVEVHHLGVKLVSAPLYTALVDSVIVIDADACVPDGEWSSKSDTGDLLSLNFASWETAMARAVARALCGDEVEDLLSSERLLATRGAGRALFRALAGHGDAGELLGEDLAARLANAELFDAVGLREPISATKLAELFADGGPEAALPYLSLPRPATDLGAWNPLMASDELARGIGVLLGRTVSCADSEIATRAAYAKKQRNLALHRSKPEIPLALPFRGPQVEIKQARARGVVGPLLLGPGRRPWLELHIHVDGRAFQTVDVDSSLPLVAVFDASTTVADERFEKVLESEVVRLAGIASAAAEKLLLSIGRSDPSLLIDDERVRQLLVAWLRKLRSSGKTSRARYELRQLDLFPTVAGKRASVADATDGNTRFARWSGEWLEPGDGEQPGPLDKPTISITDDYKGDAILELLTSLATVGATDVTDSLTTLQLSRRMSRGLLPLPTVEGAAIELKRTVAELGSRRLGPGEIALVREGPSVVVLHEMGEPVRRLTLDVWPPVRAAIEAATLIGDGGELSIEKTAALTRDIEALALELCKTVGRSLHDAGSPMPEWFRRMLVRGLLGGSLSPTDLLDLELFETTRRELVSWRGLVAQASRRGDVWYTRTRGTAEPLDEGRIVIRLSAAEVPPAFACPIAFILADDELRLDDLARANQKRSRVDAIKLGPPEREGALSVHELGGDGLGSTRGYVAPLRPESAHLRGVHVYRELQYLGREADPCRWPTVAVVDDSRIKPNRTWSRPVQDSAWNEVVKEIQEGSKLGLQSSFTAPADNLLVTRGVNESFGTSGGEIRGRVWIEAAMPVSQSVHVGLHDGNTLFTAMSENHKPLPLCGKLLLFPNDSLDRVVMTRQLQSLYRRILKQAISRYDELDEDAVAAHVAYGLALGALAARECRDIEFPSLRGETVPDYLLAAAFRDADTIAIIKPDMEAPPEIATCIIDDGSLLSATLLTIFASRAKRAEDLFLETDVEREASEIQVLDLEITGDDPSESAAPGPPPAPARPTHPLDALATAIHERLLQLGVVGSFLQTIVVAQGTRTPLLRYDDRIMSLAGDAPQLRALQLALDRKGARSADALDALVAHAVTILNRRLTEVTDAQESSALRHMLGVRG